MCSPVKHGINLPCLFNLYTHISEMKKHNEYPLLQGIWPLLKQNWLLCCITPPSTLCNAFKPLYLSCSTLLSTAAMRILLAVVFCTIFSLNIISIGIQLTSKSESSFKTVIIFINISDLLCGSYLVVLLFADFVFQEDFAVKETMWRSSFPCFMIFLISLIFSFLSATYLFFVSLCRTILVISPLNISFKNKYFIIKILVFLFTGTMSCSVLLAILYKTTNSTLPTNLCLPFIDPTNSIIFIKILTMFIALFQILASIFICITYTLLFKNLNLSDLNISKSNNRSHKGLMVQLLVVTVSNLICWIPSNIIYLSSLFISRYSIDSIIWTTIAVAPINSIINPVVFNYTALKTSFIPINCVFTISK